MKDCDPGKHHFWWLTKPNSDCWSQTGNDWEMCGGGQWIRWWKVRKILTKELAHLSLVKLPGWGSRDLLLPSDDWSPRVASFGATVRGCLGIWNCFLFCNIWSFTTPPSIFLFRADESVKWDLEHPRTSWCKPTRLRNTNELKRQVHSDSGRQQ